MNLTIPSSFNTTNMYCSSPFSCSSSSSVIKVTSTSSGSLSEIEFTVRSLITSPTDTSLQSGTRYFSIASYASDNTSIDVSNSTTQILFTLSCDPSCKTCLADDTFSCLSCYPNATLIGTVCNLCLDGQYKDPSTGNCSNCSTRCKTCFGTSTNCTSCTSNTYLNANTCGNASSCPSQTVPLNNVCQSCSGSCNECQNSTTNCVSCAEGYLKKNVNSSECVLECDSGLVRYNGICQCYLCLTCSAIYTNCTSCDSNSEYRYLYNNTCLKECPLGTYGSSSMCLPCI